jgi:hypothetical protein
MDGSENGSLAWSREENLTPASYRICQPILLCAA